MDFLKSMKLRKKSNSKDATKNKKQQETSTKVKKKGAEKNKSMRSMKTKKKSGFKNQKSKREKKSGGLPVNANLAINIFDQDSFTFRIDACINPEPSNHSTLQTQAYESFAASILSSGVEGLIKEYIETLVPFVPVGYYERTIFDQNTEQKKNRYKDVVCNDKTRVILKDGLPGDYIHANYLKGSKPLYILTQGPLKDSQHDMWRMVLQEGVAAICMLCELVEHGRPKCEPYFPDAEGQALVFGEITVTCTDYTLPDVHTQLRVLTVVDKKTGKSHKLNHHKIVTWPDKTIPLSNLSVLRTHRILRKMQGPVVVHCSAGVGRTGTFAAIEIGVQCLLNGKMFRPVDLVKAMRHCRLHSVQMDTQYLMLVEAVLDTGVAFKYIEDAKLLEAIELYKRQTADYVEAHPPPLEMVKTPVKKEKEPEEAPQVQPQNPAPTNTIYPLLSNPIGPPPQAKPASPSPSPAPAVKSPAPPPTPAQTPPLEKNPEKNPAQTAATPAGPLPLVTPATPLPGGPIPGPPPAKGQSVHMSNLWQQQSPPPPNNQPNNSTYL
ncbi:hypothetical protein L3Y34_016655 [Caenorhabditis briggsae]|uniref:Uncharacterized protein n=1 Tax=Caenorhabditis briggsae TaxID=6238 RepID=A0AAE9DWW0_CAEBR|nr:hypothetical protein L3Y34_016655 [Caenorhabditis briggsae]